MKCPQCGSENIQYATRSYGGGASLSKSCCGYILLGPLGLLCGMCNTGVETEEFWICKNCGYQFSNLEAKIDNGLNEWVENKRIEKENTKKAAEEEARNAKARYEQYKTDIKTIESKHGSLKRLKVEYNLACEERTKANDTYIQYAKELKHCKDSHIRKAARQLRPSFLLYITLWALGLFGLFLFMCDQYLAGIVLMGVAIIWGAAVSAHKDEAVEKLKTLDSRYKTLWNDLNVASIAESTLKHKIEKYEYVRDYERGKTPKNISHGEDLSTERGKFER